MLCTVAGRLHVVDEMLLCSRILAHSRRARSSLTWYARKAIHRDGECDEIRGDPAPLARAGPPSHQIKSEIVSVDHLSSVTGQEITSEMFVEAGSCDLPFFIHPRVHA
jgi:hypothetical protein